MRKSVMIFGLVFAVFCGGCNIFGLIFSETAHEKRVKAQFRLQEYGSEGVLVFVDSLKRADVAYGFDSRLEKSIRDYLVKKVRLKREDILGSEELSGLRSGRADFDMMSPVAVGAALGAGKVLYVRIENYDLFDIDGRGYYEGFLITRSILFDAGTGATLWPKSRTGEVIRVKVELETMGREATLDRLTTATAHCISRYFYDCPGNQFKRSEEEVIYGMDNW